MNPNDEAANVSTVSTGQRVGMAGRTLPEPLSVRVTDARGATLSGVFVSWTITAGTGRLVSVLDSVSADSSISTLTGARGIAQVDYVPVDLGQTIVTAAVAADATLSAEFVIDVTGVAVVISPGSSWGREFRAPDGSNIVRVPIGVTVEWVNAGPEQASVLSLCPDKCPPGGSPFDSGIMEPGDRFQFVPNVSGTWQYIDGVSWASGTLVATAAGLTGSEPASIGVESGNDQEGNAGEPLPHPLAVRVADRHGEGLPGIAVSWSVVSGAGRLEGMSSSGAVVTGLTGIDGFGYARFAPDWLGSSTIMATVETNRALAARFQVEATGVLILINDRAFVAPDGTSDVVVPVGTTVEWVSATEQASVTAFCPEECPPGGATIDSGDLRSGDRYQFVPNVPGTWRFSNANSWHWPDGTLVAY